MSEKRKFPRVTKILPIKLSNPDCDILTETKNISANGAYCSVSKNLPLMTKLEIVILLNLKKNKAKTIKKINCSGVVVRNESTNDKGKYPFRAAIYFTDLKAQDKKMLHTYVNSLL